ncbi:hypothetical protein [Catenulispora rubra]|uniref:hypothetical protein n=1 Tax=Catenulispora rubra TaxID=280293 RepID=UPI001E2BAE5A|nr:hypothetical protein [Catenulispora rubra]
MPLVCAGDQILADASSISAAGYAVALVDELESGGHPGACADGVGREPIAPAAPHATAHRVKNTPVPYAPATTPTSGKHQRAPGSGDGHRAEETEHDVIQPSSSAAVSTSEGDHAGRGEGGTAHGHLRLLAVDALI